MPGNASIRVTNNASYAQLSRGHRLGASCSYYWSAFLVLQLVILLFGYLTFMNRRAIGVNGVQWPVLVPAAVCLSCEA